MIHDEITYFDKIFERRFNFWYFYKSFWLIKIVRFQIFSKNIEFEILFLKMYTLTHFLTRDSFVAQHSQLWVTKVFTADIDISCFSLTLAEVFSVKIFLYNVNQSYFLSMSTKNFFRWCWLGLFSHWRQS